MAPFKDPNTLANTSAFTTEHTDLHIAIDFENKLVSGHVTLQLKQLSAEEREVVLDTSYLEMKKVECCGQELKWSLDARHKIYGSALRIVLPEKGCSGAIELKIEYATTKECTALQWMTPAQTSNKKHPYMFSQCQAIHARSLYPCQDTPSIKSTFTLSIRSPLPVVATGLSTGSSSYVSGTLLYTFTQPVPIPSYLTALASGDLASAQIGPRSLVYTGPEELLSCQREFSGDIERFLSAAESLVFPYTWTTYNILVLPPSFPYGGMENPNMTFATPTLIAGDRSNNDVIAHELSHSWSGNLVSNASWEHFWLNEGWTTYLERRIQGVLHGDAQFDFSAIVGWKALRESVELLGEEHAFTRLVVDLQEGDPDEAFSSVPYEKGFHFLWALEKVVGREKWDAFVPHYFKTFEKKSLDTYEFRATLLAFFNTDAAASAALAKVDWDTWFFAPGLPSKPEFDTTLADPCYALRDRWLSLSSTSDTSSTTSFTPSPADIAPFTSTQTLVFLESLPPLPLTSIRLMSRTYSFLSSQNAEILSRFLGLALKARDEQVYARTVEVLGVWGRLKFVRPLYRALNECDRALAVSTFEKWREGYHPICRGAVERDLGLV